MPPQLNSRTHTHPSRIAHRLGPTTKGKQSRQSGLTNDNSHDPRPARCAPACVGFGVGVGFGPVGRAGFRTGAGSGSTSGSGCGPSPRRASRRVFRSIQLLATQVSRSPPSITPCSRNHRRASSASPSNHARVLPSLKLYPQASISAHNRPRPTPGNSSANKTCK